MDKVWIVLRNGKIDEVFSNKEAAVAHSKALSKKWAIPEIIEKEIKNI